MLTKISLITLLALATAIPIDLIPRPILPALPRNDIHDKTLIMRNSIVIEEVMPGVYICSGKHWTGNCYWEDRVPGYCHKYNLGTASSFGPDQGVSCEIFTGGNCEGAGVPVTYPDFSDGLVGNVQSWRCT